MKKIVKGVIIILLFFGVSGCQDVLNITPRDEAQADNFFKTKDNLETAIHGLYYILSDKSLYEDDRSSDNILINNPNPRIRGNRKVPVARGSGGWSWGGLRNINFILSNYKTVDNKKAKAKYSGIARFFRAYFYFKKVKRFGGVPWYSKVLKADSKKLYKARDSRKLVMDSVLTDINYAIENIPAEKKLYRITKYTALALKSRIGLYEGTFRKYHQLGDYEKFLKAADTAATTLISSGAYTLYIKGGKNKAYRGLFARNNQDMTETILASDFKKNKRTHGVAYHWVAGVAGADGLTKDLVNSYLMADGSRFTDISGYKTMGYYDEMQNRDPRLTQTTAGPNFVVNGESTREPVDMSLASTGYRIIKALPGKDQWTSGSGYFDIILFRYGETLLNYAEAKAELGTLTQADLDMSVNKLRDRVGMPHLKMAYANAHPDPYLEHEYPNVNKSTNEGVILEIRRERRIELFNEGFRWDDLMRWKEGKKIEQPMVGMYFPGLGAYDFNNDGIPDVYVYNSDDSGAPPAVTSKIDISEVSLRDPITGKVGGTSGNLDPFPQGGKFDESKDYFYPIPKEDIQLNSNLKQNPGWKR